MTSNTNMEVLVGVLLGVLFLTMVMYEPSIINFIFFAVIFSFYFRVLFARY